MLRFAVATFTLAALAAPASAQTPIAARLYASGFSSPVGFVQDPLQRSIQYVVEQGGRIRVVQSGTVLPADFLNLAGAISSGGERGLLGLAFAPDYATSGRFYVNFTNLEGHTVVARFLRSANPLVADAASRFDLRWGGPNAPRFIAQPYANHNGGNLAFGPDGFLYIGMGDGGSGNDPEHRAQNPAELLGKMLRIDVNVSAGDAGGYRVPSDNPFIAAGPPGTRPEIWSFGLRNPWRYTFDDPSRGGTGALIIGDVGQSAWEEVDYEPPNHGGRNYGWRNREGQHPNIASLGPAFTPLTDPIHEYAHPGGISITGGYVYRGSALGPLYRGRYFFADLNGRVWSLGLTIDSLGEAHKGDLIEHTSALGGSSVLGNITSFGVGWDGELFLLNYANGTVVKIVPAARPGDYDGDGKADIAVFRPSTGVWSIVNSSTGSGGAYTWGGGGDVPVPGDYDGDGKADIAVFRPSTGVWYIVNSSTGSGGAYTWGGGGDVPVPGDYDGDGKADIAVFRPSTGVWSIVNSSTGSGVAYTWGAGGDVPVPGDYDGDGKADIAVFRPSTGVWYIVNSSTGSGRAYTWGAGGDVPVPGDYDGDGKADIAVFRPSTGVWYIVNSSTGSGLVYTWGAGGDVPVPGDYDGDGKADIAVFRPSTGVWYIIKSSTGSGLLYTWGGAGDIPNGTVVKIVPAARPGDYDGDGKADIAVFRPSTGVWYIVNSRTGRGGAYTWGVGGDVPVPGDYDGDGKADIAVFRPLTGVWYIVNSSTGSGGAYTWGAGGDVPVPGDYDGDGKADIAVFRPSTGVWYIVNSSTGSGLVYTWGAGGDVPVPGDYDGDGKADIAVFRPSTGVWYIIKSSTGSGLVYTWGAGGDVPVPGDYDGDGKADIAVFRPSTGVWYIIKSSTGSGLVYTWGVGGDVPVPGDYDGDGKADIAVFRPLTGVWYIIKSSTGSGLVYTWGVGGDIPI